jgi:hypothetical protein
MPAVLLDAYQDWYCPACGLEDRVRPPQPNRFHVCPRLHDLTAPMALAGADCKMVANLREEYAGAELLTLGDDGRPWMNIETWHADGHNDVAVFAPCARASIRFD